MDYDKIKSLMRTYLGDIVDLPELQYLFDDDPEKRYEYTQYILYEQRCPYLHKCILLTNEYPVINNYLKEYLQLYNNVNQVHEQGWSALHLASSSPYSQKI